MIWAKIEKPKIERVTINAYMIEVKLKKKNTLKNEEYTYHELSTTLPH